MSNQYEEEEYPIIEKMILEVSEWRDRAESQDQRYRARARKDAQAMLDRLAEGCQPRSTRAVVLL